MSLTGYTHDGHSWMRMGLGHYGWGLGHGKEARSVTDDHCGSWVHARTAKRQPTNKIWWGGAREVSQVTRAHRGHVMRGKIPPQKRQKEAQAQKWTERQREYRQQAQTYLRKHEIQCIIYVKKNPNNKQKQCKQNSQHRINTFSSQEQQTRKRRKTKNAQKQQKNTAKTKARKYCSENSSTVCASKTATGVKKIREHTKRQKQMFNNDKQPPNKPQKPERAPERQNSTARPTLASPNTLSTNQKNFGSI